MSQLPKGWANAVLGEVAEWSSGGTPKAGTAAFYGGEIPWAVIGDLNDGRVSATASTITPLGLQSSSAKIVGKGTVLIAMYGSIGKVGIAQIPMATNQAIACAVPSAVITREWLFWWLRSQREDLLAAGKGGTQSNISQTVLKAWPIPIAPLTEQERIVAAIEEAFSKLDAGEAGLRTVRQLLKRMRDAILTAAVTGRLVPQDPTDTPAPKLLAELGIDEASPAGCPQLPAGWCWVELGEAAYDSGYGTSVKCSFDADGPGVLRIPNIRGGRVDLTDLKRVPASASLDDSLMLAPGDLLIIRTNGSQDLIGRCAAVATSLGCSFASYLIRFRLRTGLLDGLFVSLQLSAQWWRRRLESLAASSAGQYNLSLRGLARLPISLAPLDEQLRIVAEVERQFSFIDACERAVDAGLARSAALRRSVLKAAFEGRLVPQDPSDEPASVLLERIRAERAAAPGQQGKRKKKAEAS